MKLRGFDLTRCAVAAALTVFLGSCVDTIDQEESRVGEVKQDCVVPLPDGVESWEAPVSLEHPTGSQWIWESVTLDDGSSLHNVTAFVRTAADACTGNVDLVRDDTGHPMSALALSSAEMAANAARTDGRRLDLAPEGGFVSGGRGFLYYQERLTGPGVFDFEPLGQGLCIFDSTGTMPCTRVAHGGTTRLWGPGARPLNRGGFVNADGFALIYGCAHAAAFEDPCTVARVPIASADDPGAYQFLGPFGGWVDDPANAGVLFNQAGQFSVRYNEYLGAYASIGMDIWNSQEILLRSTDATGVFGVPDTLFDAVKPATFFDGGGVEHSALSEEDGRTISVTYFTNAEGPQHGLHLVTFRFAGGAS